jgi:hypothetical protein
LQGKELGYNNIADADAAYRVGGRVRSGRRPAVAIVKHANPCGVAVGADLARRLRPRAGVRRRLAPSAGSSPSTGRLTRDAALRN